MRLAALAVLAALTGAVSAAAGSTGGLPPGWFPAGTQPGDYEMGTDPGAGRTGKACAFIRGRSEAAGGFGTLMQMFDASEYVGKRVRLSAWLKSREVTGWAGLWMRVDGPTPVGAQAGKALAFDSMQTREPLKGTVDWKRYEIVLDVAPEAQAIAFGLVLSGHGRAWMDGLQLDVVGADVPRTDGTALPKKPNLRFED